MVRVFCIACHAGFCWWFAFLLQENCTKKIQTTKQLFCSYTVDYQIDENAVAGFIKLNFPVVSISDTTKVKQGRHNLFFLF